MVSVGIDVSKEKSTVCILKPYGEVICSPFEVAHTEKSMESLAGILRDWKGKSVLSWRQQGSIISRY